MPYKYLKVTRDEHITSVTLNRPETANALNKEHLSEIEACALSFRDDEQTRVVIFTGEGNHFSSGADIQEMVKKDDTGLLMKRRRIRMGERVLNAVLGIDQITIGAWNGGAIGGGACLITAMDFRIGASGCFLQYPEIDLGLNLMWQSLPLTIRLVGASRAKKLVIGGERIYDKKLYEWDIVESVVSPGDLLSEANSFAQRYVDKSPIAAQMIKRSINHISGALDRALMHSDADQHLLAMATDDQKAARKAYLGKSIPTFTGN
jgi:enoyl-CoA hydratase/carnithine racemase